MNQKTSKYKVKDGWDIIPKEYVSNDIKGIISKGKEQDRVVDIVEDLLMDCHTELSWFFSENADSIEDQDMVYESLPDNWETVYSSVHLNDLPDSGYNIIELGYGDVYEGASFQQRDIFICLSMNGCSLASALSEYLKFTIPVIDRYSLFGIKKLVDAMNGHLTTAT